MPDVDALPDYAPLLSAYHRAFEAELRAMIADLPLAEGDRVLDSACGDGAYARWIAQRLGDSGTVLAVDRSPAYLKVAGRQRPRVGLAVADLGRLPFADNTFDLAWCAQSLYSLPDPVAALRRMRRVVRPGGVVAVLENDTLHQVLLPWPVEIELALRRAELVGFLEESEQPRKYYIARTLCQVFRAAGLADCRRRTWATDRQAPLRPLERTFLEEYLKDLRERTAPHLEPAILESFLGLIEPGGAGALLDDPDLSVTYLAHVVWGRKAHH